MKNFIEGLDSNRPATRLIRLIGRMNQLRLGDFPHKRYELSISQMELIRFVGLNPGCHIQDLAEGLNLTSPTVSVGIRKLEEEGWIERKPDPQDGRAICLHLTSKGADVLEKAFSAMVLGMQAFLEQLDAPEQDQLFGLLEKAILGVESQHKNE